MTVLRDSKTNNGSVSKNWLIGIMAFIIVALSGMVVHPLVAQVQTNETVSEQNKVDLRGMNERVNYLIKQVESIALKVGAEIVVQEVDGP